MTTPLPPYSGDTSTCPKCTGDDISVSYEQGIPTLHFGDGGPHLFKVASDARECLLRTCRDCGWAWLEACADTTHTPVDHVDLTDGTRLEFEPPVPPLFASTFARDFEDDRREPTIVKHVEAAHTVMRGRDAVGP